MSVQQHNKHNERGTSFQSVLNETTRVVENELIEQKQ